MKKTLLTAIILFISSSAFASSSEHSEAIPTSWIMFQAINLGILLIGMFFAIRKSVSLLFSNRFFSYNAQALKTAEATKAADDALAEIKNKINSLKSSENASLETAKNEAEALKAKIINESHLQGEKIKLDTHMVVAAELGFAKDEIRKEIINASIEIAKINIKKDSEKITKNSENGFLIDLANTKTKAATQVSI